MTEKILFVDDDPRVLAAFERNLRDQFDIQTALSGAAALQVLPADGPFAVVVADMQMPQMNGIQLLIRVQETAPDTVRIMLTGNADQQTAVDAVNKGHVYRFINKPCAPEVLTLTLEDALKQYRLITAEKALLDQTLNGALQVLTDILAVLDPEAFGQAQLCRTVARRVARELGIASSWDIEIAALLADLGRVPFPPAIREKVQARQPLTASEQQLLERIPEFSARLLRNIPRLGPVAEAVLYQCKNFDGSGFPHDHRSGADIPLGGRVLRVVRSLLAMHRRGMPADDAVSAILAGPEHYDPAVARALVVCLPLLQAKAPPIAGGIRKLALDQIPPGCGLLSDVVTPDGVMVLGAGAKLDAVHLQQLRNFAALNPIVEPITVEVPLQSQ